MLPITVAWLTGLPVATYLVAYSSHYEGKLKLPWPCSNLLRNKRFLEIYTRDQLTADDLIVQLQRPVQFVGNPFMDLVFLSNEELPISEMRLGLLPGSRRPELDNNILLFFI